jgi:hypothetical protein
MREVERCRASYLSTGAAVGPSAGLLRKSSDSAGLQVLLGAIGLILGAVPFARPLFMWLTENSNANIESNEG